MTPVYKSRFKSESLATTSLAVLQTHKMKLLVLCVVLSAAAAQTFLGQPAQLVLRRGQNKAILNLNQAAFQLESSSRQDGAFQNTFTGSQQPSRPRVDGFQQGLSDSQSPFISSQQSFQQRSRNSQQEFTSSNQGTRGLQDEVSSSQQRLSSTQQGLSRLQQVSGATQNLFLENQQRSDRPQQSSSTLRQGGFDDSQQAFDGISQSSSGFQQRSTFQQVPGTLQQQQQQQQQQLNTNQRLQQDAAALRSQSGQTLLNQFQQATRRQSSQGSGFQTSADLQISDGRLLRSGLSAIGESLEEVREVLEPLNLPSGARILLGDISTSFSCVDEPYGYYADQQNSCRIFHVCYPALFSSGRVETYQYSFMCGEGSVFDQKEMTCVQASDAIPCSASSEYYSRNAEFGLPEERIALFDHLSVVTNKTCLTIHNLSTGAFLTVATAQSLVGQPAQLVLLQKDNKDILGDLQLASSSGRENSPKQSFAGSQESSQQRVSNVQQSSSGTLQESSSSEKGIRGIQQGSSDSLQDSTSFQERASGIQRGSSVSQQEFISSQQSLNSNQQGSSGSQQQFSSTQQGSSGPAASKETVSGLQQASASSSQLKSESSSLLNIKKQDSNAFQQDSVASQQTSTGRQIGSSGNTQSYRGFQGGNRFQERPTTPRLQLSNNPVQDNFQEDSTSLQEQTGQASLSQLQRGTERQFPQRNGIKASSDFQLANNQLLQSGLSALTENLEGVSEVLEPLNLPSGARLLLGDISTSFSCVDEPYGYYADQQNSCRIFHVCYPALFSSGRIETYQYSFMCGEGTVFDQKELTCVQAADAIPCSASSQYYSRNEDFGLTEDIVAL
ncbi:uncharacterized protein [Panulirus ornatus]|uniref:uncharacterized protein n=1 Tax=Panulirus ornatus TaxID=150431 RepID=UPI003A88323C